MQALKALEVDLSSARNNDPNELAATMRRYRERVLMNCEKVSGWEAPHQTTFLTCHWMMHEAKVVYCLPGEGKAVIEEWESVFDTIPI